MKLKYISFFILYIICSCNKTTQNLESKYSIDIDEYMVKEPLPYSSFVEKPRTIILEDVDNPILGMVTSCQISDDYIFVLDSDKSKTLFIFNLDGKFIRQIGKFGVGPGEYIGIGSFCTDPTNKTIYLYDNMALKIHKYNYENGNYIGSIKLEQTVFDISYCNKNLFLNVKNLDSLLLEINLKSESRKEYIGKDYNLGLNSGYSGTFFHSGLNDSKIFVQLYMNTIFKIDAKGVRPHISIKSNNWVGQKDVVDISNPFRDIAIKGKYYHINNFWEIGSLVYFTYRQKYNINPVFLNSSTAEVNLYEYVYNDYLYTEKHKDGEFVCATSEKIYSIKAVSEKFKNEICPDVDKHGKLMNLDENHYVIFEYKVK